MCGGAMEKNKLFCIPYAGGSASIYNKIKPLLNDNIEIVAIELAGKGARMGEKFHSTFNDLVNDAIQCILSNNNLSTYSIFGYSMGAVISYEVMIKLIWKHMMRPKVAFFAACCPPHIPNDRNNIYNLNDQMFIQKLIELGGMPSEIYENTEIIDLFLPILRADFRLINDYNYLKLIRPLPINIEVLYSQDEDNIEEWSRYTTKDCKYHQFEGGHFFINNQLHDVANVINNSFASENKSWRK